MSDALKKSIVDADAGKVSFKLGYRERDDSAVLSAVRPSALLTEKEHGCARRYDAPRWKTFSRAGRTASWAEIEVSRKGERFCLAVGPKGAAVGA